jgi:hypothetical protein
MSIAYTSSMWRYCILYSWDADLWYPDLTRVYIWFHYTTNCLVFKFTYVIISHLIFITVIYNVIQCGFNGIVRQGAQLNLVEMRAVREWSEPWQANQLLQSKSTSSHHKSQKKKDNKRTLVPPRWQTLAAAARALHHLSTLRAGPIFFRALGRSQQKGPLRLTYVYA